MQHTDFDHLQRLGELQASRLQKQEHQKLTRLRSEQIEAGHCSLTPFPKVSSQPFRSELSIEQNSLFVSNRFKGDFFERTWLLTHPESGATFSRRLLVGKVDSKDRGRGVLTQAHQDALYHLLQLWGQKGYPLGQSEGTDYGTLKTTAYDLVLSLYGGNNASKYSRTRRIMRDLASIPIVIEDEHPELNHRSEFTLLKGVEWKERKVDKKTRRPLPGGVSEVLVEFSSHLTERFLQKHVKSLLGGPYWSLGSSEHGKRAEIARLLYPFLDAQLATKDEYHIRLDDLMLRFGLARYAFKSKRKEKMLPALRMLDRKLILSERYLLRVALRDSTDGEDYVLVARRQKEAQLPLWKDSL